MNIYFIRHGETHSNKEGLIQGSEDALTDEGILQAKSMSKRLMKTKFDIIFTSPFIRALDTAKIISKELGVSLKVIDSLVERRTPSKLVGFSSQDPFVLEINSLRKKEHEQNFDWVYDNEESFSEIKTRALNILSFLSDQQFENILVVTHGGIMKFLLSSMLFGENFDYSLQKKMSKGFLMNNTGVSVCKFIPKTEEHSERWQIVSWNDQSHLERDGALKLIN